MSRSRVYLIISVGLVALLPLFGPSEYVLSLLFTLCMYAVLATGWNVLGGFGGYLSFGQAAFFGLGGYITSLVLLKMGWSPLWTALPAGLWVGLLAMVIGYPVLRLKGPYFSLVTLLLVYVVQQFIANVPWIHAAEGFWLPDLGLSTFANRTVLFEAMLGVLGLTLVLASWIQASRWGLALFMLEEDEDAAEATGVPTTYWKVLSFGFAAATAAVAGGYFAYYRSYITPTILFDPYISITPVVMALFGGRRVWYGPIFGAFFLGLVSEWLTIALGSEASRVAFGLLLVFVILFLPEGVLGSLVLKLKHRPAVRAYTGGATGG